MSGASDYEKDFEKLMAPLEERADGQAENEASQFLAELKARGRAVGITFSEIVTRVEADKGFEGVLPEIKSREERRRVDGCSIDRKDEGDA